MAGFRLTTKVQVSGWRFLLRRVEHAIVRRDTRMFDDPLQFYSRAVSAGIIIAVLICLGAALLAYFKPLGKRGGDTLLVDRTTNQLYVRDAGQRAAAAGVQPDLGTPGAGQRGHPGRGEVRRTEQDAQGPADRHSRRALRHTRFRASPSRCGRCATPSPSPRAWLPAVETSVDRAAGGHRRLGRPDAPGPGRAGVVRRTTTGWSPRPGGTPSISPTAPSPPRWGFRSPPRRPRSRKACSTRCRTRGRGSCRRCRPPVSRIPLGCRQSGDRLGIQDGHRGRRTALCGAARRRRAGQRHHGRGVARDELLRIDRAAVGGSQRGREDRRAGVRVAATR